MNGKSQDLAPLTGGACSGGGNRADFDTSAPFESVREAVDRFGGSAAWSSHFIKRMSAPQKKQDQCEEIEEECVNLEAQTAQLENELSVKERETLDVLKELESTKKIIADLKLKIQKESADASTITDQPGQAKVPIAKLEEKQPENVVTDVDMGGLEKNVDAEKDPEKTWSPIVEIQFRGRTYRGRCQEGVPEGKGCLTYNDGSFYDGLWSHICRTLYSRFHKCWNNELQKQNLGCCELFIVASVEGSG